MLKVALKGLLGHKLRFALTTAAVVLGVTFLAGSFVLTDSIQRAFDGLFDDVYADVDVFVNPVEPIDDLSSQAPGAGATLPASLVDEIAAIDGVERVAGGVEGVAQILGEDGQPLGTPGAPALAENYDPMSPVDIASGEAPDGPDEVAIDRASAQQLEVELGDGVVIFVAGERRTFTVSAVTSFGSSDNLLGATMVSFDLTTAQDLLEKDGEFDSIGVAATEGVDVEDLRDRIAAAVGGDDVEVVTGAEEAESGKAEIAEALGFLTTALLAFAGVALFVSAFIIANTFSIVVAQRSREFALLRALGASARQVRLAVVVEALAVGLIASAVGILLGVGTAVGIREALSAVGLTLPDSGVVLAPRTVVVSFVVGVGVTVVASLSASRRASRTSPVEAMRGQTEAVEKDLRRRVAAGTVVTALGAAALLFGLFGASSDELAIVGAGAAASLLGVALLAPLFAGPVAALLGGVAGRLGISGRLAQRNAGRDRRRTAATASALMIGVALVTFVSVLTATLQGAVAETIGEQFKADFIVQTTTFGPPGLSQSLVDELRAAPELGAVSAVGIGSFLGADELPRGIAAVDASDVTELVAVEWPDGAVDALLAGEALVGQQTLEDLGLEVGDRIPVTYGNGTDAEFHIAGTYDEESQFLVGGALTLERSVLEETGGSYATFAAFVDSTGDLEVARDAIGAITQEYPAVSFQDQAEFREQQESQVDSILNLFLALLGLALLIALLGIANTLALAVFERTREIGLLRAVGLDRGQAGRMIVAEAVIVSVFGAALGLVVGTGFGWAVVTAIGDSADIGAPTIPFLRMGVYLVAAALAGAVAAVFPAWRAARLDVLRAVTTE